VTTERIWFCKIGGPADFFENGADLPMRRAIAKAFREITGRDPQFTFSGWGGKLTEGERAVVENREPKRCELDHPHHYACTHCGIGPPIAGQPGLETRCEHGERDGYCIVCHNPALNRSDD
jgi:hypothetical protein